MQQTHSQAWLVRLQVLAPSQNALATEEIRSHEIAVSARSGATAGAKAVALAKGYGWKVRAIEDVRPAPLNHLDLDGPVELLDDTPPHSNLLNFPMPTGKPN